MAVQASLEQVIQVAPAVAAASGTAAVLTALQDWIGAVFGVPLPVVFGAFAGACYGVTFNQKVTWGRLISSVLVAMSLGTVLAPLVMSYFFPTAPAAALAGGSALASFALQYAGPWLMANRERLLEKYLGGGPK